MPKSQWNLWNLNLIVNDHVNLFIASEANNAQMTNNNWTKGNVDDRTCHFINWESLEITLIVPLTNSIFWPLSPGYPPPRLVGSSKCIHLINLSLLCIHCCRWPRKLQTIIQYPDKYIDFIIFKTCQINLTE